MNTLSLTTRLLPAAGLSPNLSLSHACNSQQQYHPVSVCLLALCSLLSLSAIWPRTRAHTRAALHPMTYVSGVNGAVRAVRSAAGSPRTSVAVQHLPLLPFVPVFIALGLLILFTVAAAVILLTVLYVAALADSLARHHPMPRPLGTQLRRLLLLTIPLLRRPSWSGAGLS